MAVVWPVTLPQSPLLDGYEETPPEIVLRSTVDAGPPKVRRRFTANIAIIRCRFSMTKTQVATFDDFYFGPAGGGSVVFELPHPRRAETVRARIREVPSYSNAGHPEDAWTVGVVLEILPPGMPA